MTTNGEVRPALTFRPLTVPKAPDVLARELRERILSGEIEEGSALPTERDLVRQTHMSRATVREALRILEVQNLLRVKAGRSGGAFVQLPTTKSMSDSVSMLIRGRQIKPADLLETREAVEPFCAALAARNRTGADLVLLDDADRAIADGDADLACFLRANLDWHIGVAVAGHNELLIGFMTGLAKAIYAGTEDASFVDERVRAATVRTHKSITAAIRKGDAETAGRRMRRHVQAYASSARHADQRLAILVEDD